MPVCILVLTFRQLFHFSILIDILQWNDKCSSAGVSVLAWHAHGMCIAGVLATFFLLFYLDWNVQSLIGAVAMAGWLAWHAAAAEALDSFVVILEPTNTMLHVHFLCAHAAHARAFIRAAGSMLSYMHL